ncbi:phenylacetate--CoA ligase family protein, partial [Candidatus Poribacteria bacterium]|nr:phenylacetate--CoA ligase family protein [Candidatus Poribacteria bacterium]
MLRITHHVSRFTFHVSHFTHHVSRFTLMSIFSSAKTLFSKAAWAGYNTSRQGVHYQRRFAEMEARLNGSCEVISQFQWERVRKLLTHAYQTTPYYRALFQSLRLSPDDIQHPADLSQIPALEKSTLRTRLADLISEAFPKRRLKRNATGGSSGTPVIFYQDRGYWNQRNMSVYYFDRWAGWDFGERQLIIWGALVDVSTAKSLKARLNNYWRNYWWLNGFNLTAETMIHAFEQMRRWRPQTILAYASSLYLFAKCLHQNQLVPNWGLKGIISSAEMLHPHYRELAEQVFKTKVYNRYGSREVGLIAMECQAGRM